MENNFEQTIQDIVNLLKTKTINEFWLHFDTDVIHDEESPAVNYRTPGGLSFQDCERLMRAFPGTNKVMGISIGIYNPDLDRNGIVGKKQTSLLINLLR